MSSWELTFNKPVIIPPKRRTTAIEWTPEMLLLLTAEFSTSFNNDLALTLKVSSRTLVRKARELGLEKEEGFLDKRRDVITSMMVKAKPPHPMKGVKGWCVPNSEAHRFTPGHTRTVSAETYLRIHAKRRQTLNRDKARIRMGLKPLTKLIKRY